MKIVLINAKYSANLGDGALSECLEDQIQKRITGSVVSSIDISGSDDFGGHNSMVAGSPMKGIFNIVPDCIQKIIRYTLRPILVRKRFSQKWKEQLEGVDAIVIGGGHLFMDVQRYFPTRILIAVESAAKGTPVFVHAVGVSKKFTKVGQKYFNKAFNHGRFVSGSVRDADSQQKWNSHFNPQARISWDPALLAFDTYKYSSEDKSQRDRKIVALGVSDPSDMMAHADNQDDMIGTGISFFIDTATLLVKEGFNVSLFTNGADQDYLDQVIEALTSQDDDIRQRVSVMPRALKPIELVRQIEQADILVAHRLHANILAYSYKVPSVGLMWDQKVASFFKITRREEYLVNESSPAQVIEKVKSAVVDGVDEFWHKKVISDTKSSIDRLVEELSDLKKL